VEKLLPFIRSSIYKTYSCLCVQGGNPGELKVMLNAASLTKGGKAFAFHLQLNI
jgi:hypothetical protein